MATTITINDDTAALKTALGAAVTAGYFASVDDHDTDGTVDGVICYYTGGTGVLSLYKVTAGGSRTRWAYRFGPSIETEVSEDYMGAVHSTQDYSAQITKMYICSGGIYIAFKSTGNGNGKFGGIAISKTNRNKTGIVVMAVPSSGTPTSVYKGNFRAFASDDDVEQAALYFSFGGQNLRNQTQMFSVSSSANPDAVSYFPDIKYLPICQYNYVDNVNTPPVPFVHNDERYLWVGSFAIKDTAADS